MSVGLLLITHKNIASSLLSTTRQMLNSCPLEIKTIEVELDAPVADVLTQARNDIQSLDNGHGVLVLTDIFGSTPANISQQLCCDFNCKLISGVNLPMLVRILNYPKLNLEHMALKAITGGHDGILLCGCQEEDH